MFGPELRSWLLTLDDKSLVLFVRGLLEAEANRLHADLGIIGMTGNVDAADEGVDGRTGIPDGAPTVFPSGPRTWQIKSGKSEPSIPNELAKKGVQTDLKSGRDYVLVWSKDPVNRQAMEEALDAQVKAIAPERMGLLLTEEDLERLAQLHPEVVQAHGGPRLLGLTLDQWGLALEVNAFPFTADDARHKGVELIRRFAESDELAKTHLHVFGDTGVGKSRAVYEALPAGLRERTVVCPDARSVEESRLAQIISTPNATLVLVVDDVTREQAKALEVFASAAQGRIRLVTLGDRPTRD